MSRPVVCLVDDEPICLESMQALITALGYECRAYADGEALIENIAPVPHGMILADYRLPRINGLQLFEKVREMGTTCLTCLSAATAMTKTFSEP